jgi:hypothetical protein
MTIHPTAALARALQIVIACAAAGALVADTWAYTWLRDGTFLLHVPADERVTPFWTTSSTPGAVGLLFLPGAVMLAAEIVWLFWQHHATENIWARGYGDLQIRPGWAVGWWFIPIANLFMPCVAMLELDRRSTPDGTARRASPVIGIWWAAWLACSLAPLVGYVAVVAGPLRDLIAGIDAGTTVLDFTPVAHAVAPWVLVTGVAQAVAAGLAIAVIRRIDAGQGAMLAGPSGWTMPVPIRPDARL